MKKVEVQDKTQDYLNIDAQAKQYTSPNLTVRHVEFWKREITHRLKYRNAIGTNISTRCHSKTSN